MTVAVQYECYSTFVLKTRYILVKKPDEAVAQTLTGSIFTSVTENASAITPSSISNVTVSGTGASLTTGANGVDTISSQNGEFTMTLYTQAYGSHNAGDYSITNTATTTESLGFTVSFTATDSSGNVSPLAAYRSTQSIQDVSQAPSITINEAATQTLTAASSPV